MRRFLIGLGGAVGLLIGGASPALAQSGGGSTDNLVLIGSIAGGFAPNKSAVSPRLAPAFADRQH